MANVEARIAQLGLELPQATKPAANFVPCVQTGNTLFVSGQISLGSGRRGYVGKVGQDVSVDDARIAARTCALNILSQVKEFLGSLDRVRRVCMVQGFVNATPDFTDHPKVMNGASDLFVELFGDAGKHARFAIGVTSLPLNAAVEVAAIFEVA